MTIPTWLKNVREFSGSENEVWVHIMIWAVEDICTSDQTHTCYFQMRYGWYDPDVPEDIFKNYPDIDAGEKPTDEMLQAVYAKRPGFEWVDSTEVEWVDQQGPYVDQSLDGGAEITMYHNVRATFKDPVDIADFPYDIQDFKITIGLTSSSCEQNEGYFNLERVLVAERNTKTIENSEVSTINVENKWTPEFEIAGLVPDKWNDRDNWQRATGWNVLHTKTNGEKGWSSQISFSYTTKRHHFFYTMNILAVTTLMSVFTWMGFAIDPSDVADRLGYDITILLTVVALKFAFTDAVPVVPYNTMLDWKLILTTGLIFVATVMHGVLGYIARSASGDKIEDNDNVMALILLILLGLFEVVYWVVAVYKMYRTSEDYFEDQDEEEMQQKGNLSSGGSFVNLGVEMRRKERRSSKSALSPTASNPHLVVTSNDNLTPSLPL